MPAVMTTSIPVAVTNPSGTVDGSASRTTTAASAPTRTCAATADHAPGSTLRDTIEATNPSNAARPRTLPASAITKTPISSIRHVIIR